MRMRADAISSNTTISCLQNLVVVMETPALGKIFRRLLSHQTCSTLRYHRPSSLRPAPTYHEQRRSYKGRRDGHDPDDRAQSSWQQRTQILPPDKLEEYEKAPLVTAHLLRGRRERPRRVKMLTRDFIEGLDPHPFPGRIMLNQTFQTVYIIQTTGTSPNKRPFSRQASPSISTPFPTNQNSIVN